MAAQFSAQDMLTQEVQKLEERKASLVNQIKAQTGMIKDLQERVVLAKLESQHHVQEAQDACAARCAALQLETAPYEALKQTYEALKQQMERLQREHVEKLGTMKAAMGTTMQAQQRQLTEANTRLAALEAAIASCKAKVASL